MIAVTKDNVSEPPRACRATDPESPAKAAGFLPGDRIVTFNGNRGDELAPASRTRSGPTAPRPRPIVVERDGKQVTLHPKTVVSTVPDLKNAERVTKAGFLGLVPTTVNERQGVGFVVTTMVDGHLADRQGDRRDAGAGSTTSPARPIGLEERDANSPISVVGAGRVAGEMASAARGRPSAPGSSRCSRCWPG